LGCVDGVVHNPGAEACATGLRAHRVVKEHALFKEHKGHSNHLCELVSKRKMDRVADLSKDPRYVCNICGRAAAKAANVCEPVEI